MTTTPAAPAVTSTPPKTAAKDTGYRVLELDDSGFWTLNGTVHASNMNAAIRKFADKSDKARTLVAIPARSWKPQKVTPNTVTKLVVEDIKP